MSTMFYSAGSRMMHYVFAGENCICGGQEVIGAPHKGMERGLPRLSGTVGIEEKGICCVSWPAGNGSLRSVTRVT